jgi:cytochrome c oxidase assembly protein subunit 15
VQIASSSDGRPARRRLHERWPISPALVGKIATVVIVCYALLVVTGGAVRLTGSGLGCADWPTCSRTSIIASASFHPLVEFSNRCVTIAVSIVSVVAFLATLLRAPRRRDLIWLGTAVLGGLLAQVILGGLVVLFKLNPYLVALHFVLTLVVLAVAILLRQRNLHGEGKATPVVPSELVWLNRLQLATLSVLVLAGTMVTGAGPHAGGPGAKRVPIAFRDIAELHADIALFLIGLSLATLLALHLGNAPAAVQRRSRFFLEMLALQGVLGYTQYFLHDNAVVIEFHLAGVTILWCAMVIQYLGCFSWPLEEVPPVAASDEPAAAALGASLRP